jgi:hypothetical protein
LRDGLSVRLVQIEGKTEESKRVGQTIRPS